MDFELDVTPSLLQSTIAYISNDEGGDTVFLAGSSYGYRTFCSSEITPSMMAYCSVFYTSVDPLYFKSSNMIPMGHTEQPIRAFCKHRDRVFAFNDKPKDVLVNDNVGGLNKIGGIIVIIHDVTKQER